MPFKDGETSKLAYGCHVSGSSGKVYLYVQHKQPQLIMTIHITVTYQVSLEAIQTMQEIIL